MKRAKVLAIPADVKAWLDAALVESNFSGYEALAAELKSRGYEISKSALHRYGQNFGERLGALKAASEQAKAIVEASPDDEGAMNEALIRLVQERVFGVLMDMEVDPAKVNISALVRSTAQLTRASVNSKKWVSEVRQKVTAKLDAMEASARASGPDADGKRALDLETLRRVREEFYGLVEAA